MAIGKGVKTRRGGAEGDPHSQAYETLNMDSFEIVSGWNNKNCVLR
jgi:hypothetical protein